MLTSFIDPYALGTGKGGRKQTTFFQELFGAGEDAAIERSIPGCAGLGDIAEDVAPLEGRDAALEKTFAAPSLSASQRIRAWKTTSDKASHTMDEMTSSTLLANESYSSFIGAGDVPPTWASQAGHHETSDVTPETHDRQSSVPFALRVREVERRFREQMEVHRGLTSALRQIGLVEGSAQKLRAERRTRVLLQELTGRQDVLWARVWPDSKAPPLDAASGPQREFPWMVPPPAPISLRCMPSTALPLSSVLSPQSVDSGAAAAPAVASPPLASPTSTLMQEILETFSKPREQRVQSSATSSPSPSIHGNATKSKAPAATSTGSPKPSPGTSIRFPEPAPKSYKVIRYVLAAPNQTSLDSSAASAARRTSVVGCVAPKTEGEKELEDYSQDFSSIGEDVAEDMESSSTVRTDVSIPEVTPVAPPSEVSSAASTVASHSFASEGANEVTTDGVAQSSITETSYGIETELSTTLTRTSATESVASAAFAEDDSTQVTTSSSSVPDASLLKIESSGSLDSRTQAKPFMEVLTALAEACRSVTAVAAQLHRSPYMQERSKGAVARGGDSGSPNKSLSETPPSSESSVEEQDETAGTDPAFPTRSTVALSEPPAGAWRETLQRQLRYVRKLQRFHKHLIRHVEVVDLRRQTHGRSMRLLKEIQAVAKLRKRLLTASTTADREALRAELRRLVASSAGKVREEHRRERNRSSRTRENTTPRNRHSGISSAVSDEGDVISEMIAAESANSIRSDVESETSKIEDEWGSVGNGDSGVITDSIVEEVRSGPSHGSSITSVISSSLADGSGDVEDDFPSDAALMEDAIEDPSWLGSSVVTGGSLDEVEETLAEKLVGLSSDAIASQNSTPSEVEDLIDLLPSSVVSSDVEEAPLYETEDPHAQSTVPTSSIVTEKSSSIDALQRQQRHNYAGAVGSMTRRAVAGAPARNEALDNKRYLRDFPGSSVYSVAEDGDVDDSMRRSTIHSESALESSVSVKADVLAESEKGTPKQKWPTSSSASASSSTAMAHERRSGDVDQRNEGGSSSSIDALTALEMDMRLTQQRRRRALRRPTAAPTFNQLYDPLITTAEEMTGESGDDGHAEDCDSASDADGDSNAGAVSAYSPPPALSQGDAPQIPLTEAPVLSAPHEGDALLSLPSPPRPSLKKYPAEDHVAQNAWKANQMHLLRQLRSFPVDAASQPPGKMPGRTRDDLELGLSLRSTGMAPSVEVAMDVAEAAARQEWAQHWGVVESLLETRFAVRSNNSAHENAVRFFFPRSEVRPQRLPRSADVSTGSRDASSSQP